MRIVVAGTPEVAVPTLDALISAGHDIVGIVTREDAPVGRKRVLTPSPLAERAAELEIDTWKTNTPSAELTEWIEARTPDLGVVVAYGGLLKRDLLDAPRLGWVNLHFSDLPRWRGAAPVQRALMNGEQQLGMTVFRLVEALDAGDVVARSAATFEEATSAGDALAHLAVVGADLVVDAVAMLDADPTAGTPQEGESMYARKLQREDGRLSVANDTTALIAHWAGVTPAPGATLEADGTPLKVLALARHSPVPGLTPGTATIVAQRAVLGLADGAVELMRVQPAGKAAMEGAAWLRGRGGEVELS